MEKKKPDLVVWNEEKGYYQRELTYGSNQGAPAIKLEDVGGWKQMQAGVANKQFQSKYEELKAEYQKLIDEVNWNELVYQSTYSFIPVMGEVYHLYMRNDDTTFLSLISPNQWNKKYIGSFKLDSTQKWTKVEI
jgi:Protein of unknown function (DUF2452)